MSSFDLPAGVSPARLGLAARALGLPFDPCRPVDVAGDPGAWLQARMLWLVCGLTTAFACLYSVYFLSIGLWPAAPVGGVCLLASVAVLRFARATGRYHHAFDYIGVFLFAMFAGATLFQDGIHSPALWWLGASAIVAMLAGRAVLGAALCVLFAAQAALLYRLGPGSIGPVSLMSDDPALQLAVAMSLSAVFVGVCAALSAHWGGQLRRALERAREAALAASAAKARFVTQVSHEIRTPLHGMIGATEMLRQATLGDARRASLVDVQRQSADVLMSLVNAVLDFSKLEAGKVVLEHRPLHLAALVKDVEAFFAPEAGAKGIDLVSTCSPDVPELVLGDSARVRQIVTNLVANAIKFTASGGVHIHLGLDGETPRDAVPDGGEMRVRIQVADSGVGIDAARIPFLFKPFHQADESIARRFGGTGLGLSIADDLAQLMGGHIEATSAVGRGSTFTLVMPLAVPEVPPGFEPLLRGGPGVAPVMDEAKALRRLGQAPSLDLASLAGVVVVVAEDDPANQAVVVAMVEALHARAVVASTGHEALAVLARHPVDVVLMDVHMPGLDGLSATRAWRRRGGGAAASLRRCRSWR
ncbi:MAG: response regulator [Burkholderiales bacterium]|nr:response regulator [Burkholderiales bacterium]